MEFEATTLLSGLEYLTLGLITVVSIVLWVRWLGRWKSDKLPLLNSRSRVQSPIGLLDVGSMFFLFAIGQVVAVTVCAIGFGLALEDMDTSDPKTLLLVMTLGSVFQLLTVLLSLGIVMFRYRAGGLAVTSWQSKCIKKDLRIGMYAFLMIIPIVLLIQVVLTQLIPYEHATMQLLAQDKRIGTILATWFAAVIVAPVTEEIFFRGMLQNWLQRVGRQKFWAKNHQVVTVFGGFTHLPEQADHELKTGMNPAKNLDPIDPATTNFENENASWEKHSEASLSPYASPSPVPMESADYQPQFVKEDSALFWLPIVVTSVLFGVVHAGQGPAPIPLFFFSLALGYVYRRTNSILPCIALHFFLNAFSMFWFTLGQFVTE